jgi:hypothetical protein
LEAVSRDAFESGGVSKPPASPALGGVRRARRERTPPRSPLRRRTPPRFVGWGSARAPSSTRRTSEQSPTCRRWPKRSTTAVGRSTSAFRRTGPPALSEITTAGYQPNHEHVVEINITPLAEAEIVPKTVDDEVL